MSVELRSPAPNAGRGTLLRAREAAELVPTGARMMVGGFGLVGTPLGLLDALVDHTETAELTVISNNLGEPGRGLGRLLSAGRIRRAVGSFFTSNPDAVAAHERGDLQVELLPQGTLAEAIRAGGAGLGGFYTRTGVGTTLAEGREVRSIDGFDHLFQPALRAEVALIRAAAADEFGNLVYRRTARNFNPDMATAADLVIAEVEAVHPVGCLDPDEIITPHIYVDHLVLTDRHRD